MSKPISDTISSTSHLDLPQTDSWGNELGADGKPIKYLRGDPYADATAKHNGQVQVAEVRPTFEELNSIERHRREILLRVSSLCDMLYKVEIVVPLLTVIYAPSPYYNI